MSAAPCPQRPQVGSVVDVGGHYGVLAAVSLNTKER